MSTATAPAPHPTTPRGDRAPLARLVAVELRKAVDTRAGRWLLGATALAAAVTCAVLLGTSEGPGERTFAALFTAVQVPVGLLVPLVAIITVTGESSTRNVVLTVLLVPDRTRVVVAKVAGVVLLVLAVVAVSAAAAALATLVGSGLGAGSGTGSATRPGGDGGVQRWAAPPALLLGAAAHQLLLALVGAGLGLLLASSPLAIATYLLAPTLLTLLTVVEALAGPLAWVDLHASLGALDALHQAPPDAGQWGRIAVTTAAWAVLPLAGGLLRFHRRDIA